MRLPPAGIFISTARRAEFRGVGGALRQKYRKIELSTFFLQRGYSTFVRSALDVVRLAMLISILR